MTIVDIISSKRIIVVLGAGGVGKTTSSAALAVSAAQLGKKVALLSIDPAKRLADAMGIKLGSDLCRVDLGSQCRGELHAAMLDQAAVFDAMVKRFASPSAQAKIFQNSVYKQVSCNLGGPLEYMALAKLSEIVDDDFDTIILDTPPDVHALDFLRRPNILSGFTEAGVMRFLIKPFFLAQRLGVGRLLTFGEKLMGGIAAVTGVGILEKVAEFFVLMDDVIKGFQGSGSKVQTHLKSASTAFGIISSPFPSSMRACDKILKELAADSFPLGFVILNRVPKVYGIDDSSITSGVPPVSYWLKSLEEKRLLGERSRALLENQLKAHQFSGVKISTIEESSEVIADLSGIRVFSRSLGFEY